VPPEQICTVGEVDICFETFGDPSDPAVLLVMGLATQMLAWHQELCEQLAERGFHVIRFDNRDIGRSGGSTAARRPPCSSSCAGTAAPRPTRLTTWRRTGWDCSTTSGSSAPTWSAPRWAA
jgi:pimeloyl-ACP methyl ester carboxylesterase